MPRAPAMLVTILVALLAIPLMIVAAALVTFNTPQGRYVLEVATDWVTRGTVRLDGLAGRFPDRLRLRRLSIRDAHGSWLVADAVALEWSPLEFLHDRIHIEHLTAARVALLRPPSYGSAHHRPRREPQRPFELPFTIQLDQSTLPEVDLAASLAGNATAVSLAGGGSFKSLHQIVFQARAQRLDRQPSAYALYLQSNADQVQGRLDLQEEANGPLTNLVGLPGLGALSVHLSLLGPANALATTLDAHAGPMQAQANGTIDLPAFAASLRLSVEAPAMTLRPGFSWRRISLQAQSQGQLIAPTTRAQVALDGLTIGTLELQSLQATLNGEGRGLALDATLAGLRLPGPVQTMFAHAPIRLHGQAQMVSAGGLDMHLTLEHPLLQAQAHYELGNATGTPQANASSARSNRGDQASAPERRNGGTLVATVPELRPWAQLAKLNLQGRGTVTASLAVQKDATHITATSDLQLRDGDALWMGLLGSRAKFDGAMTIRPEQIELERAQLSSPFLTASLHGSKQDKRLDIAWEAALSSLARVSRAATGTLSGQGRVQGTLARLNATLELNSALAVHDQRGVLHAQLQAQDLLVRPSGQVQVSGSLAGAPLSLIASVQAGSTQSMTVALEHVDWKSVHADGTLRVDGDWHSPQGTVALRVAQLQDVGAVLGEPIEGAINASVVFDRSGGRSQGHVKFDGENVALASTRIATLQLRGLVTDPLRSPQLALQLSSEGQVQNSPVALSAQVNGSLDALALVLEAQAKPAPVVSPAATNGAPLSLAGSKLQAHAIWSQSRQLLKINQFEAQYRQESLHLAAPALISFQNGINIEQLRLQWPPATVQVQGRLTPQLDLRASVHNFNPGAVGVVMPLLQAQGRTNIDVDLHGALSHPTGTVSLTAGGLSATAGAARGLPPAELKFNAQLNGEAAEVIATLSAGTHMQLRASGTVPLRRSGTIGIHLAGTMDLAMLNPIVEASGQRLLGELSVEAQVSGTTAAPQAKGSLSISHGEVQDYPRGFHITDLAMAIDADGSQVTLKQFKARAGAGTLSASGSVALSSPGMPLQLEVTAQNAEPLKSDLLTTNLNADLKIAGGILRRDLVASGTIKINKATINIPNALPPDVQTLEVVRPGQGPPPAPPKPIVARMNLTLNAPRGIYVRGRGLSAEVGGTAHVSGTSSAPMISGGFDLINGLIDIAGATLTFSSGRVSFNGTGLQHKIDPTINFVATSAQGDQAKLTISGYADAPVITLSSANNYPPDQILAQLLFGQNTSQLSALQVAGIASALVTLTGAGGGGGGLNPLNAVQRALGLNRLVISSNSQPGATPQTQSNAGYTIQAGRYVTNRVYVGAKQSTNGLTQAQVQVDITRQLKVQTTLSTGGGTVQGATPENDPGSSVGVSYSFQY